MYKFPFRSNLLDSAGDGGFNVSGLTHSDGDADRSRFVVTWPKLRDKLALCPIGSDRWPNDDPKCVPVKPSGILFSDRNSSKSAYYKENNKNIVWVFSHK